MHLIEKHLQRQSCSYVYYLTSCQPWQYYSPPAKLWNEAASLTAQFVAAVIGAVAASVSTGVWLCQSVVSSAVVHKAQGYQKKKKKKITKQNT